MKASLHKLARERIFYRFLATSQSALLVILLYCYILASSDPTGLLWLAPAEGCSALRASHRRPLAGLLCLCSTQPCQPFHHSAPLALPLPHATCITQPTPPPTPGHCIDGSAVGLEFGLKKYKNGCFPAYLAFSTFPALSWAHTGVFLPNIFASIFPI